MLQRAQFWLLLGVVLLAVFMVTHPGSAVSSAQAGLNLWAMVIVPALLPFFIIAELLVSMGLVRFLGVMLEPVMQPLFRLPGCSSLVVAMGFTSGFPVGAILTRRLYDDNLLQAEEAERLLSFTNNSSPLFILGAVGMGMFGSAKLGWLLAISHYAANLLVGVLGRFRAAPVPKRGYLSAHKRWQEAKKALQSTIGAEGFNARLARAIKHSSANILAIGGYIMIFSVITGMLSDWGAMGQLAKVIRLAFSRWGLSYQVAYGISMGCFEITLGANAIAAVTDTNLLHQLVAVTAVLAFSGLCIITQVMGVMIGTPVRLAYYLKARLLQASIAVLFTLLGYRLWALGSAPTSKLLLLPTPLYSLPAWPWSLYCLLVMVLIMLLLLCISRFVRN